MFTRRSYTFALVATTALICAGIAQADTVQQTITTTTTTVPSRGPSWESITEVKGVPVAGARIIPFMEFDINKDKLLSAAEVGESLFKIYDTDGNEVIDNIEFKRRSVLTVMPIEKNTTITYDFDSDGRPDESQHTYQTFMQDSQLARFDKNKDGLSPADFTDRSFLEADINDDKVVDMQEWKGSYIASIDKKNVIEASTNK